MKSLTDYQIKTRALVFMLLAIATFAYVGAAVSILHVIHPTPPPCREVPRGSQEACSVPATQRVILFPAKEQADG